MTALPLLLAAALMLIGGGTRIVQASSNGLGWLCVGAGLSAFGTWLGLEIRDRRDP